MIIDLRKFEIAEKLLPGEEILKLVLILALLLIKLTLEGTVIIHLYILFISHSYYRL